MALNIELIKKSFDQAKPIGPKVVAKFYEILFEDYPQAKGLFAKVNLQQQQKALLNSLVYIVDHLESEKALHDYLFKMGQRHVKYGSQELHYDWVGASLLKTFAFFFKEAWTEELNNEWVTAYGVIKSIMLEGQHSVKAEPPSIRTRAQELCSALLLDILENELDPEVLAAFRTKVKSLMLTCLEDECSKIVKKSA